MNQYINQSLNQSTVIHWSIPNKIMFIQAWKWPCSSGIFVITFWFCSVFCDHNVSHFYINKKLCHAAMIDRSLKIQTSTYLLNHNGFPCGSFSLYQLWDSNHWLIYGYHLSDNIFHWERTVKLYSVSHRSGKCRFMITCLVTTCRCKTLVLPRGFCNPKINMLLIIISETSTIIDSARWL